MKSHKLFRYCCSKSRMKLLVNTSLILDIVLPWLFVSFWALVPATAAAWSAGSSGSSSSSSSSGRSSNTPAITTSSSRFFPPVVSVTTDTILPDQSPTDVQQFLASPGNWPKIVTSSVGVSSPRSSSNNNNKNKIKNNNNVDLSRPLPVGQQVDEIFGLPPIVRLSVQWTCTKSVLPAKTRGSTSSIAPPPGKELMKKDRLGGILGGIEGMKRIASLPQSEKADSLSAAGRLEFFSPEGLKGVARECEMIFDILPETTTTTTTTTVTASNNKGTKVSLEMKYKPQSILAWLAVPILTLDNAIALQFLLPAAMRDQPELDKFRNLMGSLYLGAGLAHLIDCVVGPSQLLNSIGAPPFDMLPIAGQIVALVWCFVGPLSFVLSKYQGGGKGYADLGLILYGLVEVGAAGLVSLNYGVGGGGGGDASAALIVMNSSSAFVNAILVQGVVAAAWFYSASKDQQ